MSPLNKVGLFLIVPLSVVLIMVFSGLEDLILPFLWVVGLGVGAVIAIYIAVTVTRFVRENIAIILVGSLLLVLFLGVVVLGGRLATVQAQNMRLDRELHVTQSERDAAQELFENEFAREGLFELAELALNLKGLGIGGWLVAGILGVSGGAAAGAAARHRHLPKVARILILIVGSALAFGVSAASFSSMLADASAEVAETTVLMTLTGSDEYWLLTPMGYQLNALLASAEALGKSLIKFGDTVFPLISALWAVLKRKRRQG